jgi:hypothetical protein
MFKTIKTSQDHLVEKNQQVKDQRIAELKHLLAESDYKVLPDYDNHNEAVKAQRQLWRDEIRALKSL